MRGCRCFVILILFVCAKASIEFAENVVPESFVYLPSYFASNNSFVTGSIVSQKLFLVSVNGEVTGFWPLPSSMQGSIMGLELDTKRDRLLFCESSLTPQITSTRGILWSLKLPLKDQQDGSTFPLVDFYVDLGQTFCNDIAIDKDGNAYVTDTQNSRILKVDLLGNMSPFTTVQTPNGIEFNDDYLLVGSGSELIRIPLNLSSPRNRVNVRNMGEGSYDGIAFDPCKLQLSVNWPSQNQFAVLESNDDWNTAYAVHAQGTTDCTNTASFWVEGHFFYSCAKNFNQGRTYSINIVPKIISHFWNPESDEELVCTQCTRPQQEKCYYV